MSSIQVVVEGGEKDRNKLADLVDDEIRSFDDWFTGSFDGAEPLAKFEKAILKTYLMNKLESMASKA